MEWRIMCIGVGGQSVEKLNNPGKGKDDSYKDGFWLVSRGRPTFQEKRTKVKVNNNGCPRTVRMQWSWWNREQLAGEVWPVYGVPWRSAELSFGVKTISVVCGKEREIAHEFKNNYYYFLEPYLNFFLFTCRMLKISRIGIFWETFFFCSFCHYLPNRQIFIV